MLCVSVLLAAGSGCSSSGRMKESEQAVAGFQQTSMDLDKGKAKVDAVVAAMDQLSTSSDLQKAFNNFRSKLEDLEKSSEDARKRAQAMRQNAQAYITKWQQEMATINDPSIRAAAAQRREAVRANFEQVKTDAQAAREAYDPFLAHLKEIQHVLSIDLTPANVQALKPTMDEVHKEADTLKQKADVLKADLDRIRNGMSPTSKPAQS
jgi:chromosome segregation ATPase